MNQFKTSSRKPNFKIMKIYVSLGRTLYVGWMILVLIFCFERGICQTSTADSLQKILPGKSGKEKVDILFNLAYELVDLDNCLALTYARLAFNSTSCEDSARIVKAGRLKALALRRMNFMDSSLALSLEILPIARRVALPQELKALLNGIGNVYTEQAKYDKALQSYWESLEVVNQYKDAFDLSVAMNNIGIVYYKLFDIENALTYFNKAIELRRQTERKYDFSSILVNAAIANANLHNYKKASMLIAEALAFCGKECTKELLMQASFTSGFISYKKDDCTLAEKLFLQSFELSKEISDERFMLDNISYIANINIQLGNYALAENYLQLARETIRLAGTSYNKEIKEVYKQLAFVYEKLQDYRKFSYYQKRYIGLSDSTYNEEIASRLMRIQAQHLERENKIKLQAQDEILAANMQVLRRQKYLNFATAGVAFLLLALAIVLAKSNKQKERLNSLLDLKVKERTKTLEINQTILQSACEERDLILKRLISEIRNSISTVKGLCTLARKDSSDINVYIDQVDHTSERFLQIVETLSHSKRGQSNLQ